MNPMMSAFLSVSTILLRKPPSVRGARSGTSPSVTPAREAFEVGGSNLLRTFVQQVKQYRSAQLLRFSFSKISFTKLIIVIPSRHSNL